MQTDWCRYLAKHMLRERLGPVAGWGRISFGEKDWETLAGSALRKLTRNRIFPRTTIYRRFFEEGDLSAVFDDRR